jgi:hypothetical protein
VIERQEVLEALYSSRFADAAPAQVWATLLNEGAYLGSESTCVQQPGRHERKGAIMT